MRQHLSPLVWETYFERMTREYSLQWKDGKKGERTDFLSRRQRTSISERDENVEENGTLRPDEYPEGK